MCKKCRAVEKARVNKTVSALGQYCRSETYAGRGINLCVTAVALLLLWERQTDGQTHTRPTLYAVRCERGQRNKPSGVVGPLAARGGAQICRPSKA